MLQQKDICRKYDLSSVRFVFSGAAPLGEETIDEIKEMYPDWTIAQAYGTPFSLSPFLFSSFCFCSPSILTQP
jgi:acyl-coenzyme A synthetase/AMP-(fatty) acid ligase